MSEPELKPCKRCGHTPLEMNGLGEHRYFCPHCCHEFEKSVTAEWGQTEEEAREAWNAMQEVPEKEVDQSSSFVELFDFLIDQLSIKIQSVSTVSQSAKQQCGNSHVAASFNYLISEAAVMQDRLFEIKRVIERRPK